MVVQVYDGTAHSLPFVSQLVPHSSLHLISIVLTVDSNIEILHSACAEAAVGVSEPQRLPAARQPPAVWEGPLSRHYQIPPCGLQVQTK